MQHFNSLPMDMNYLRKDMLSYWSKSYYKINNFCDFINFPIKAGVIKYC